MHLQIPGTSWPLKEKDTNTTFGQILIVTIILGAEKYVRSINVLTNMFARDSNQQKLFRKALLKRGLQTQGQRSSSSKTLNLII